MPDSGALRARRARAHAAGDHALCRPSCGGSLRVARPADAPALLAAVEAEFAGEDALVRALAVRLATVAAEGHGVAAVSALRALGELVAAQRDTS
jgi:hypothetical protein